MVNKTVKEVNEGGQRVIHKRTGRRKLLNPISSRQIIRHVKEFGSSASTIKTELCLKVGVRTIQRVLHKSNEMTYLKMKKKARISEAQIDQRIKFSITYQTWNTEWKRTIFSDEKRFNFDGPDGFAYYWHNLKAEETYFSTRQQGGAQ